MDVKRGFTIIILSGIGFAVSGAVFGYFLACLMPAYYRGVFAGGDSPSFNPVQVGVGLGFSQGMIAGVVIGAVVVLAVAIASAKRPAGESHGSNR